MSFLKQSPFFAQFHDPEAALSRAMKDRDDSLSKSQETSNSQPIDLEQRFSAQLPDFFQALLNDDDAVYMDPQPMVSITEASSEPTMSQRELLSQQDYFQISSSLSRTERLRHIYLQQQPSVELTLCFCYLGLLQLQHPIFPLDLLEWAKEGSLMFFGVYKFLPRTASRKVFIPTFVPKPLAVASWTRQLCAQLKLSPHPVPLRRAVLRFSRALHLPDSLCGLVEELYHLLDVPLSLDKCVLPSTVILALLVVALKLVVPHHKPLELLLAHTRDAPNEEAASQDHVCEEVTDGVVIEVDSCAESDSIHPNVHHAVERLAKVVLERSRVGALVTHSPHFSSFNLTNGQVEEEFCDPSEMHASTLARRLTQRRRARKQSSRDQTDLGSAGQPPSPAVLAFFERLEAPSLPHLLLRWNQDLGRNPCDWENFDPADPLCRQAFFHFQQSVFSFPLGERDLKLRNLLLDGRRAAFPPVSPGHRTFTSVLPDAAPDAAPAVPAQFPSSSQSVAPIEVPFLPVLPDQNGELPFQRYVHHPRFGYRCEEDLHPILDAVLVRFSVLADVTPAFFFSEVARVERALFTGKPFEPYVGHYDYERGLGSGVTASYPTNKHSKTSASKRRRHRQPRAALSQLERDLGSRLI